jgi:hypothetical protein
MARPNSLDRLDPETRRDALKAARRASALTNRIRTARERHDARIAALEAQRADAWREATDAGMSATEAAKVAGLHHSAVDRALA